MKKAIGKSFSLLLAMLLVLSSFTILTDLGSVKTQAASWNGYNYGGGSVEGYQTILDAYGIDYDVYMKWLDDHDADSANPHYYLGTPYEEYDHRNPYGDCDGAYGDYDEPGVAAMNCTGFVWHVLYKAAVHSGASDEQIDELGVMGGVLSSWSSNGVYRIFFDDLDEAYDSGVLEKGDVMWIYGDDDNHNAIFYGDNPHDWWYWDSAGDENRYCEVHAIGDCLGVYVCKVTQPDIIQLSINTRSGGSSCFGTKYCVFTSQSAAQKAIDNPNSDAAWDKRIGTIVLDSKGSGTLREKSAPSKSELWKDGKAQTNLSYFSSSAREVDSWNTYYAVQWSASEGNMTDKSVHVFKDSGKRDSNGCRIFSFNAPKKVATPEFTTAKSTYSGVSLKWKAVKGAERYRIYYKSAKGVWTRMAETTSTSYLDKDVISGKSYTYTIRCVDKDGNFTSSFNNTGWKVTHKVLDTPKMKSLKSEADGLRLKWGAVDGAVRYRVYYKNIKGNWVRMATTSKTEYLDSKVSYGSSYVYTMRCVDKDGDFVSGYSAGGWKGTYKGLDTTPTITSLTSEPQGIKLGWDAVEGAAKYRLYHKNSSGKWERIGETADTGYLDENVTAGNSYTYTIRCLNSSGSVSSGYDSTGWTQKYTGLSTPKITGVTSEAGGNRIKWDPVENAYKYRVYYKNSNGNWIKMTETAATEYVHSNAVSGTSYTYTVRCVNSKGGFTSDFDRTGYKSTYKAPDPEINKAESVDGGLKVSWKKISGVPKYRVFRYGSDGWERLADVTGTSYTDKNVKSGTEYRYTLRSLDSSGNYSSGYSKAGYKATYIATPVIDTATVSSDGIALSWKAVKGAYGYRVFKYGANGWNRIATVTSTSYTDTAVKSDTTYKYTVRCVDKDGDYISSYKSAGKSAKFIAAPVATKLVCNNSGVTVTWDAVEGASLYRVFRKNGSTWDKLGDTSSTSFTDKTVGDGKTYTYTIRCMDKSKNYISDFIHKGFTIKYVQYIDFDVVSDENGVTVSWAGIEGAASYKVYKKTDGSTWKTADTVDGTSWTDTKAQEGSTYLYTVRAMDENGVFISGYLSQGKQITYEKPQPPEEEPEQGTEYESQIIYEGTEPGAEAPLPQ